MRRTHQWMASCVAIYSVVVYIILTLFALKDDGRKSMATITHWFSEDVSHNATLVDSSSAKSDIPSTLSCFTPRDSDGGTVLLSLPTPIVNLGFPSTSAASTIADLFKCGNRFNVSHHTCFDSSSEKGSRWCGVCIRDAVARGDGPLGSCGNYGAYLQVEITHPTKGLCVWPQIQFLEQIHNEHPNATFLLDIRNAHDWRYAVKNWDSLSNRVSSCFNISSRHEDVAGFICNQVKRVRNFVSKHPSHALVELDLGDKKAGTYLADLFGINESCLQRLSDTTANSTPPIAPDLMNNSARQGLFKEAQNSSSRLKPSNTSLWDERLWNKQRNVYVFFKHMRKAGGTSIRKYLDNVVLYHQAIHPKENISIYEQEFYAMDWRCPQIDMRWNDAISVVGVRHPIERHLSEFFYSGPGRNKTIYDWVETKKYTVEFANFLREELPAWIDDGMHKHRENGALGGQFVDNFQLRALTGETSALPDYREAQHHCVRRKKLKQCQTCQRCHGPCQYGGRFGGGTRAYHHLSQATLKRAMSVLESFDVVLLSETFSTQEQAAYVADIMRVPESFASLSKVRANVIVQRDDSEERYQGYQNVLRNTAPELLALLEEHSRYELELYKHAERINQDRLLQWKRTKKPE